jgi:hydrogenase maturation factor HypF (carbamoyltransferase family)
MSGTANQALCQQCEFSIEEATIKVMGFGSQPCPHCGEQYTLYHKIKDDRTGPYGVFMEQMCSNCAIARKTCQFCEAPTR